MMKRLKLEAARHERSLSQKELANELGVSRESISGWERGVSDPQASQVRALCNYFEKDDPRDLDIDMKRRQILGYAAQMAGASLMPIEQTRTASAIDRMHLDHSEQLINTCWQLLKVDGLIAAGHLLPTFLPSLDSMAQHPGIYQKDAAYLAAQGYIIYGLVAVLQMNYTLAEEHCKRAIVFSRVAEDKNLEVAALKHLATKYMDIGAPQKVLRTYQEALPLIGNASPLLQSRTYLGLSVASAQCGQKQEAWKYFGLAEETFPENPLNDPGFTYADCGPSSFNHYGGLICMEEDEPSKAWERFAGISQLRITIPERTIIEIINCQAEAAIAERNMELATSHIKDGIAGAVKLKSDKRRNDTYSAYKKMRAVWPHEKQVRELAGLFQ